LNKTLNRDLDIDKIKRAANIVAIIKSRVPGLKSTGAGEYAGLCPFHGDKRTPSLTVTPAKGLWYCFGCQATGNVVEFVEKFDQMTFRAAGLAVATMAGLSPEDALLQPAGGAGAAPRAAKATHGPLPKPEPKPERRRGPIRPEDIANVYSYVDEANSLIYEVLRLKVPPGAPKDFRQRRADGRMGLGAEGETRRVLFRLPRVLAASHVYLVEGEKDVETLERHGLVATTLSGGANARWLPDYSEALAGRTVVVIPDNDEPGRKRLAATMPELSASDAVALTLPRGKDVTEFLEDHGGTVAELADLEAAAREDARQVELEAKVLLTPEEVIERHQGGVEAFLDCKKREPGIRTGFTQLDEMTLGLHSGELIVLAGRPAMGKTAMALNIVESACEQGVPVYVYSLEMPSDALLARLLCGRARINLLDFRAGAITGAETTRARVALADISEWPLHLCDHASLTLEGLEESLDGKVPGLVVLDYLQLMDCRAETRTQAVSQLSRGLKLLARRKKAPFLVLSQLSRAGAAEKRKPYLSDLRESGSIEQDADGVWFVWREELVKPDRPDLRGLAELIVGKQRNGPIGSVELAFESRYTKFMNMYSAGETV
jgi:replicative DNA helicase